MLPRPEYTSNCYSKSMAYNLHLQVSVEISPQYTSDAKNKALRPWAHDIVNHFWHCSRKASGNLDAFIPPNVLDKKSTGSHRLSTAQRQEKDKNDRLSQGGFHGCNKVIPQAAGSHGNSLQKM
ncbi:hypothetical protein ScPMuIL_002689 [Solemya velum]